MIFNSENASKTIMIANEACIIPMLTTFLNADVLPIENVLVTGKTCTHKLIHSSMFASAVVVVVNLAVAVAVVLTLLLILLCCCCYC